MPGWGYRAFAIPPGVGTNTQSISPGNAIENEFFRIEPNWDTGALTLIDRISGTVYRGCNRFVDSGDRGDLYNYCPPENDTLVDAPAQSPHITIETGVARQSLRIEMLYRLPAQLSKERTARAPDLIDEKIVTTISIYPGVRRIDFRTEIDNRARDHRLRVEFPTPIVTAYANAEQAFDVVSRSLEMPSDTSDWIEQPRPEAPTQNFVLIANETISAALAARGLPEYEARSDANGTTLALTLLRCVGWLSRNDLATRSGDAGPQMETPGAQEIGAHVFEYAFLPHDNNFQNTLAEVRAFCAPMRAVMPSSQTTGDLPTTMSFIETSPREFVISAIKVADDASGIIVRGYNITENIIAARLRVWKQFARAARVNLNEEEITPIALRDGRQVEFQARAKEIVTIKFQA